MRSKPTLTDFKSIAIIQTAFLGDSIIAMSFAAAIKKLNPGSRIVFVTTPQALPIAKICNDIDLAVAFDKRGKHAGLAGVNLLAEELRNQAIDCVISLHKSLRTTLLVKKTGVKFAIGFHEAAASFLYDARVHRVTHLHEAARNFEILSAFSNCTPPDWKKIRPGFNFSQAAQKSIEEILTLFAGKKLVVVAPGSVWETKRWGENRFTELAGELEKLGYGIIVLGAESEKDICERVAVRAGENCVSLAGKLSVEKSLALIAKASLVIANDSAPTHMANATNTPAITVFGATSEIFGFYPYGDLDATLENKKLRCHPCRIHGGRRCPIGTLECMKSVKVKFALEAALKILDQ